MWDSVVFPTFSYFLSFFFSCLSCFRLMGLVVITVFALRCVDPLACAFFFARLFDVVVLFAFAIYASCWIENIISFYNNNNIEGDFGEKNSFGGWCIANMAYNIVISFEMLVKFYFHCLVVFEGRNSSNFFFIHSYHGLKQNAVLPFNVENSSLLLLLIIIIQTQRYFDSIKFFPPGNDLHILLMHVDIFIANPVGNCC